jgi:(2R)-3-sulfolactate dehydrogenase (NADP+)
MEICRVLRGLFLRCQELKSVGKKMQEKTNIGIDEALELVQNAFVASGLNQQSAQSVARALVMAEAEGQVGHGFSRVGDYIAQMKSGKINAEATPFVVSRSPSYLHVSADNGFAYPALDFAVEQAVTMAETTGCVAIAVSQSNHCGTLASHVEKLAMQGMIGLMVANTPAAIAPWGGNKPLYGTNPIAFAAPRAVQDPLVIDLSLSVVARGKVMNAKKTGQTIPEGWALDKDGQSTTDPSAALDGGTMVPIGEAKGTALALMVEILAASLTGANTSADMPSFFAPSGPSANAGQFLIAIKPNDMGRAMMRIEALLNDIAETPGARLPGVRRIEARNHALKEGLYVPSQYVADIQAMLS